MDSKTQKKEAVTWDLSDLYSGIEDPSVEKTLDSLLETAEGFSDRYKGRIDSDELTADMLRQAIVEYEKILQELDKPISFASLLFAADTNDPKRGAFLQRMMERSSEVRIRSMFFELELAALSEERVTALLEDPVLAEYRHYVWAERLFREYRLSEPEEKILEEKANTGGRAFVRLFQELESNIGFEAIGEGEAQTITLPEVLALLRDPDREVRRKASGRLTDGLVSNGRTLTYVFNTLIQDKATNDRLRRYSYPEQARNLANELDADTVELVVKTAVDNYDLVARYYRLKREILGYDRLMHYDRYAPLFAAKEEVPFSRARDTVLESLGRFSPLLADAACKFFEKRWIDAEVREGKRSGAFCSYVTPDLHPYILVNYLHRLEDVMTLAHELGHGVHACVARSRGYLNFSPVLPVAELASTFAETLVFEDLQAQASLEDRLALYAERIEGAFATIFRQAAMYRFEQAIHAWRREKGELTTEEFGALWQGCQQEMFGDSLLLGDEHRFWWMYVSHFIHAPFYVYAYTFGELLVLALYAMYRKEGESFPPRYVKLLKAGGSAAPADMLSRIGVNIGEPAFWQGGMEVLSGLIDDFEALYREWAGSAQARS